MLNDIKTFFELEYSSTIKYLESPSAKGYERQAVDSAICRCLSVALFAQKIGAPFEGIKFLYETYKKKLEKLLDNK